jgi:DNA-binding beta-propeller fold protein YncE
MLGLIGNLDHIKADKRGDLWVTSRGDYKQFPSRLYFIDKTQQKVTDTLPIAVSNFYLDGDSLYTYSTARSYVTYSNVISYGIVNTRTHEIVTHSFITDGTDKEIETPYGIMVNPVTKDIYVTDAGSYVSPGILYCFAKDGTKKWSVRTGDIPAHFALLPK